MAHLEEGFDATLQLCLNLLLCNISLHEPDATLFEDLTLKAGKFMLLKALAGGPTDAPTIQHDNMALATRVTFTAADTGLRAQLTVRLTQRVIVFESRNEPLNLHYAGFVFFDEAIDQLQGGQVRYGDHFPDSYLGAIDQRIQLSVERTELLKHRVADVVLLA